MSKSALEIAREGLALFTVDADTTETGAADAYFNYQEHAMENYASLCRKLIAVADIASNDYAEPSAALDRIQVLLHGN